MTRFASRAVPRPPARLLPARWVAVRLPQLSLEAFAATLPAPIPAEAVAAGEGGRPPLALLEGARIVAVDATAAALGVRPGMARATALALAPALQGGHADAVRDAQALQAVAHAALAFTPSVALHPPDAVLLEVAASLRLFGGLPALLQRLREALAPLGHHLHLACAPTALGAALLARWAPAVPLLGAHATRREALRTLLDQAPAALLCEGPAQAEALQGMGLHTLAEVRALPREGLARRLGPAWLERLDRARGDAPDPRPCVRLPDAFDARLELFTRADDAAMLLHAAQALLARLAAWARGSQGRVEGFTLALHHEARHRADEDTPACTALTVGLALPSADAAHLQALLRERLERTALPAPVMALSLQCRALARTAPPNGELFPTRAGEREGLARLLERLQARLGADRVTRLVAVEDHRPERATAHRPLQGEADPAVAGAGAAQRLLTRPVWLLPAPQPLAERGPLPLLDGRPLQLLVGPERIESGWWDDAPVARDYFIAQAADGALVWVCRARLPLSQPGGGWFLHGRFA